MRNLAGVETEIVNSIIRIELAKAGIPAFSGEVKRQQEVPASIVGIKVFAPAGSRQKLQTVVFTRSWYYWVVKLEQPLPLKQAKELNIKWRETVRVDGFAGGTDPGDKGVDVYHVDTQEGLNTLVEVINQTFASSSVMTWTWRDFLAYSTETLGKYFDWIYPDSLTPVIASNDKQTLMRHEIAGLMALGCFRNRPKHAEDCYREALQIAEDNELFKEMKQIQITLSNFYREECRKLMGLLEHQQSESNDKLMTLDELEKALSRRLPLLQALKRRKEAQSVEVLLGITRSSLATAEKWHIDKLEAVLLDLEGKQDSALADRIGYKKFELALQCINHAQLLQKMGQTDEAQRIMAKGENIRSGLPERDQKQIAQ